VFSWKRSLQKFYSARTRGKGERKTLISKAIRKKTENNAGEAEDHRGTSKSSLGGGGPTKTLNRRMEERVLFKKHGGGGPCNVVGEVCLKH